MDHIFVYDPSSGVKDPSVRGPRFGDLRIGAARQDLPETCRECGETCTVTERRICLSQLDGRFC